MSETIWFEQVDTAFIDFIRSGIYINDFPVKCKVRKPDEDFKKEEYPFISIRLRTVVQQSEIHSRLEAGT